MRDIRREEAAREAAEIAANRRFDALDTRKMLDDIKTKEFPDEWLEEAKSEATK